MSRVEIHLVAFHPAMAFVWRRSFDRIEKVSVLEGDILKYEADAIVSPANSFGFMDGGIDLLYSQHFGWDMEKRLQRKMKEEFGGEMPVGCAAIVETGSDRIPWLISAPTMRVPMRIDDTANVYLAFRAALRAVEAFNRTHPVGIRTLLCPALGTGEGRMPFDRCALQMLRAYESVHMNQEERGGWTCRRGEASHGTDRA